jgi:hypothetical protein
MLIAYSVKKMIEMQLIKVTNPVNPITACETQLTVVGLIDEFS